jgi:hypothetical protein
MIDRFDPDRGGPTMTRDAATPPMLAWPTPKPPTLCCCMTSSGRGPGSLEKVDAAFGQLGVCADVWVASSILERRRSRAMPMVSMKTKKPMKPMLAMLEITEEAGLNSPSHPASTPTSRPSHPIHRGSARVVRATIPRTPSG